MFHYYNFLPYCTTSHVLKMYMFILSIKCVLYIFSQVFILALGSMKLTIVREFKLQNLKTLENICLFYSTEKEEKSINNED